MVVFWVICSQQLKPSVMMVASALLRTAGRRTRSPSFWEISYLSFSKPKGPAMPQQPESRSSTSAPVARRIVISSAMDMVARWWQWPWTMTFLVELWGLVVGGELDEELA